MSFHQICFPNFQFIRNGVFPPDRPIAEYYKAGTMNAYNYAKTEAEKNLGEGWESMVKGAQPVWNIGCWQAPMVPSGYNPQPSPTLDPAYAGLGPFQDSVINGLFYLMVHRTFGQPNMGTKEDIETMETFYRNWMGEGIPALTQDQRLYNRISPTVGLFRERVSIYSGGTAIPTYRPHLAWAGDQGLMLSALTYSFSRQQGPQQLATFQLITSTINGVFNHVLGNIDTSHQNVIMPWCHVNLQPSDQPGPAPGGDHGDYFSGTGVFMRGLLEAATIPAIKLLIQDSTQIQTVLSNTVAAMQDGDNYMSSVWPYHPSSGSNLWFNDFNKMATLLAASQLLK